MLPPLLHQPPVHDEQTRAYKPEEEKDVIWPGSTEKSTERKSKLHMCIMLQRAKGHESALGSSG